MLMERRIGDQSNVRIYCGLIMEQIRVIPSRAGRQEGSFIPGLPTELSLVVLINKQDWPEPERNNLG